MNGSQRIGETTKSDARKNLLEEEEEKKGNLQLTSGFALCSGLRPARVLSVYGRGYRQIFWFGSTTSTTIGVLGAAIGTVCCLPTPHGLDNRCCLKPGYIFLESSLIVTHGQTFVANYL